MSKSKNKIILAIASLLASLKSEGVKLEEVKTADGVTLFAEKFEAGEPVFILQDDAQVPCPVGSYALADGRTLVVTEEGVIGEIQTEAAPPATEPEVETEAGKEKKMYSAEEIQKMISDALAVEAAKTEAMRSELAQMKAELAANPRVEPITPSPEGGKTNMQANLSTDTPRKQRSTLDRVMEIMSEN